MKFELLHDTEGRRSLFSMLTSEPVTLEIVDIFSKPGFETHATVADLLSPAHLPWRKTLSFSILA